MNEFELIDHLTGDLIKKNNTIIKNIGDDTAVIRYDKNSLLLLTTDSLVEKIHFRLDYKINKEKLWYFLGWKALAVNISDILAMGGKPVHALVSLHLPSRIAAKSLKTLYKGLKDCASKYKVSIVGGNTARSKHDLIITVSMTGLAEPSHLLLREGAKTGDYIYTQKGAGRSKAGLKLLLKGYKKINELILSHLKPIPSIPWNELQKKYRITSAIDISDGFLGDLGHILKSSGKGAEIELKNIPPDEKIEKFFPAQKNNFFLYGGEDYKIIFTSPGVIKMKGICLIGKIKQQKGIFLTDNGEKRRINDPKGFIHF